MEEKKDWDNLTREMISMGIDFRTVNRIRSNFKLPSLCYYKDELTHTSKVPRKERFNMWLGQLRISLINFTGW